MFIVQPIRAWRSSMIGRSGGALTPARRRSSQQTAGPPPLRLSAHLRSPPLKAQSPGELMEDLPIWQPPSRVKGAPSEVPMLVQCDEDAAQTWVYPINLPRRNYQFTIVRQALFENTLVALPTGLGKTFIAGCVMLNHARWFPNGKIIFVAPTRPLVSQQAQAFPETCGFLNDKIAVLMGVISADKRAALYPQKQVFFMTAQTFKNDITNGLIDPREVVLLVVDEAHKCTKNHAYSQVANLLQDRNPNVRILALTATPSSKVDGVQAVVDNLQLSRIEIRNETSPDLKPYMHKKTTDIIVVRQTELVHSLKKIIAAQMQPLMNRLHEGGLLRAKEASQPARLSAYRCLALVQQHRLTGEDAGLLFTLSRYARAMGYLLAHSTTMCEGELKGTAIHRGVQREIQIARTAGDFYPHPKMPVLRRLLRAHFASRQEEGASSSAMDPTDTRVIVYCSYRQCVNEVVEMLAKDQPHIRPFAFIGQADTRTGEEGLSQKEQLQAIADFKSGKFNVMVATSIGEEGLDIGSVDKIICYDVSKSPLRMLQRSGRAGRKREGSVAVLVGEGNEDGAWEIAQRAYLNVQRAITKGDKIEVRYASPRLLPAHIEPKCDERVVPIDPSPPAFLNLVRKKQAAKGTAAKKGGAAGLGKQEGDGADAAGRPKRAPAKAAPTTEAATGAKNGSDPPATQPESSEPAPSTTKKKRGRPKKAVKAQAE